jgi:hypothetical protein
MKNFLNNLTVFLKIEQVAYKERKKIILRDNKEMFFLEEFLVHFDGVMDRQNKIKKAAYEALPEKIRLDREAAEATLSVQKIFFITVAKTLLFNVCLVVIVLFMYGTLVFQFDGNISYATGALTYCYCAFFISILVYGLSGEIYFLYLYIKTNFTVIVLTAFYGLDPKKNTYAYFMKSLWDKLFTACYLIFWFWAFYEVCFFFMNIPADDTGFVQPDYQALGEELKARDIKKKEENLEILTLKEHRFILIAIIVSHQVIVPSLKILYKWYLQS